MSTHVFPLGGPIDPPCSICGKTRSEIEREDRTAALVARLVAAIKTDLRGAGLAVIRADGSGLSSEEYNRALDAMARNLLHGWFLQLELEAL